MKTDSIARLFEAYGAKADSRRAEIYLEQVSGWSSTVVDAAVTRLLGSWPHVSLPPVGKLVTACREVGEEDRVHRGRHGDEAPGLRPMTPEDKRLCRLMRELYDEGLDWCDATGQWVAAGQAERLSEEHPQYRAMTVDASEQALAAVMRSELVGDSKTRERRQGKGGPKSKSGLTPLAGDLGGVTREQSDVFD